MDYFIYLTTNLITGEQYIGQHKGKRNDSYLGSGVILAKAIKKYGKENFKREILCFCSSQEELDKKEKEYIAFFDAVNNPNFYNLSAGGQKGDGWEAYRRWRVLHPEEAQRLNKESYKNIQKWQQDNPEKVAQNIQKMLEACHKYWKDNPQKMFTHMEEVNKAKEEWQKNNPEKHAAQVESWRKKGTETNKKPIICITTGEIFSSISEAGRAYGIPQGNISKCLKGERKSAGKHPVTQEKLFWAFIPKE